MEEQKNDKPVESPSEVKDAISDAPVHPVGGDSGSVSSPVPTPAPSERPVTPDAPAVDPVDPVADPVAPGMNETDILHVLHAFIKKYTVATSEGAYNVFQTFTYGEMTIAFLLTCILAVMVFKWIYEVLRYG